MNFPSSPTRRTSSWTYLVVLLIEVHSGSLLLKKVFVLLLSMLAVRKDLRKSFRLSQFKRIATTCNRLIATVSNTLLHDIYEGAK